jgi:hypothetical protein
MRSLYPPLVAGFLIVWRKHMERAAELFSPWYPLFIGIVEALIGAASMYFSLISRINIVVEQKLNDGPVRT